MSPLHFNVLKFITIACVWIIVLIIIVKFTNDNDQGYYLDPEIRRVELARAEPIEKPSKDDQLKHNPKKLLTDTSIRVPNEQEWLYQIEQELPSVPFDYWFRYSNELQKNTTACAKYPNLMRLNFHNTYWQTFQNQNITFQIFGAYYDKRGNLPNGPVVRLLAMANQKDDIEFPMTFCQLWFNNNTQPVVTAVLEYHRIYPPYWGLFSNYLYPYLITCTPLGDEHKQVPYTISLVGKECEQAKNNLRVWFEHPEPNQAKNTFAVCVKGLNFPYSDNSVRLVEWLELLRILGAGKVYIYNLGIHHNALKVLSYYQKIGFVDLRPITLAGGEPNLPHYQYRLLTMDPMNKRLNEFIPYNDCLYRHMYKHDYIAAIDIDEIIMPLGSRNNWSELIEAVHEIKRSKYPECLDGFAGICFLNAYFVNDPQSLEATIPVYMYMLRHVFRSVKYSGINDATKCFHNTREVRTLHNHFPLTWLKSCSPITLGEDIAQLQHYREPDKESSDDKSDNLLADTSIWRYTLELKLKTQQILETLGFLV